MQDAAGAAVVFSQASGAQRAYTRSVVRVTEPVRSSWADPCGCHSYNGARPGFRFRGSDLRSARWVCRNYSEGPTGRNTSAWNRFSGSPAFRVSVVNAVSVMAWLPHA